MSEDERRIYEMIVSLADHQAKRGQHQEAFTSTFIANEIAKGTHRQPHTGWHNADEYVRLNSPAHLVA